MDGFKEFYRGKFRKTIAIGDLWAFFVLCLLAFIDFPDSQVRFLIIFLSFFLPGTILYLRNPNRFRESYEPQRLASNRKVKKIKHYLEFVTTFFFMSSCGLLLIGFFIAAVIVVYRVISVVYQGIVGFF